MILTAFQQRVLGALIEKEIATPETYPLSLNALLNACNQRSSREPVLDLTEEEVRQALHGLEAHGLTTAVRDSRVAKFEHRARTVLNLRRDETAILCLLLLRGPQTPGELRGRADRLYSFDDLPAVQVTLDRLAARPSPAEGKPAAFQGSLVVMLARQPGSRESRYAHLLGGIPAFEESRARSAPPEDTQTDRLSQLELNMEELRSRIATLEAALEATLPTHIKPKLGRTADPL